MEINFKDKKVTLVGLGQYQHGSGISAAKFLLRQGARLTVTDLKPQEKLAAQQETLDKFHKQLKKTGVNRHPIKYVWGRHEKEDFTTADWIFRNPSVPNRSEFLQLARKHNVPIDTDDSLFLRLCPAPVIGITGTRGKSTTTSLIYEMLKASHGTRKVFLGGNILHSPLEFLSKIKPTDWVVLELSSWQTESFIPFKISPHISVVTNLYPDHLNTYDGMEDYAAAKEAILKFQRPSDYAVLNWDNAYTRRMGRSTTGQRFWFSLKSSLKAEGVYVKNDKVWLMRDKCLTELADLKNIKLLGEHNRYNIAAASLAAYLAGVSPETIAKVSKSFKGLPNRLELVRDFKGIKFYNDTTATTAEGTIAALKCFKPRQAVLIAGGSEKNLPFGELASEIIKRARQVVLLNDKASFRIEKEIRRRSKSFKIEWADTMKEAVIKARAKAAKGNVVLMSPACASFGLFKNEFDRGEKFALAVKSLK